MAREVMPGNRRGEVVDVAAVLQALGQFHIPQFHGQACADASNVDRHGAISQVNSYPGLAFLSATEKDIANCSRIGSGGRATRRTRRGCRGSLKDARRRLVAGLHALAPAT
jgi:hypothetical protein